MDGLILDDSRPLIIIKKPLSESGMTNLLSTLFANVMRISAWSGARLCKFSADAADTAELNLCEEERGGASRSFLKLHPRVPRGHTRAVTLYCCIVTEVGTILYRIETFCTYLTHLARDSPPSHPRTYTPRARPIRSFVLATSGMYVRAAE